MKTIKTYNNTTKEDVIKALTEAVEDAYTHNPKAIDIRVQGDVYSIPEVTVEYTYYMEASK